jgi:hypothetical protein
VVFRLTQDEYRYLQKACSSSGARSISDFTRKELLGKAAAVERNGLEGRLSSFEKKLSDLQSSLRQLNQLLKKLRDSDQL